MPRTRPAQAEGAASLLEAGDRVIHSSALPRAAMQLTGHRSERAFAGYVEDRDAVVDDAGRYPPL
ncbi:hypothetical protein [Azospirillum brasilense]|uniref:hypothetical protein n=1 Tax=Azospirillum brasilense TaxID=192 RepID=UPI001EDBEC03|nr:hypothetical protein [Azospirillum brasilense]UKJ75390.1 hypothetical protein H1Q64_14110 [Azospirillum brasilense]